VHTTIKTASGGGESNEAEQGWVLARGSEVASPQPAESHSQQGQASRHATLVEKFAHRRAMSETLALGDARRGGRRMKFELPFLQGSRCACSRTPR
jgi:hypothetical protein